MAVRDPFAGASRDAAKALRRLPAEARKVTGREVQERVAEPLAEAVRQRYTAGPPMVAALAQAVKTRVQVEPVLVVGGARRLVSGGAKGRQLVYGVEFGSGSVVKRARQLGATGRARGSTRGTTAQFAGPGHDVVFGTFRARAEQTYTAWLGVLDTVLDQWKT